MIIPTPDNLSFRERCSISLLILMTYTAAGTLSGTLGALGLYLFNQKEHDITAFSAFGAAGAGVFGLTRFAASRCLPVKFFDKRKGGCSKTIEAACLSVSTLVSPLVGYGILKNLMNLSVVSPTEAVHVATAGALAVGGSCFAILLFCVLPYLAIKACRPQPRQSGLVIELSDPYIPDDSHRYALYSEL